MIQVCPYRLARRVSKTHDGACVTCLSRKVSCRIELVGPCKVEGDSGSASRPRQPRETLPFDSFETALPDLQETNCELSAGTGFRCFPLFYLRYEHSTAFPLFAFARHRKFDTLPLRARCLGLCCYLFSMWLWDMRRSAVDPTSRGVLCQTTRRYWVVR